MRRWSPPTKHSFAALGLIVAAVALAGIIAEYAEQRTQLREHAEAITGGDPWRGEALFIHYGCGSCHALSDVRTATGSVGPPLDGIALRVILAGKLSNTPTNMERWIHDPQSVTPGTAMPRLGVSQGDARDITAFLYTRAK